jgi:hypothetical protein
VRTALAGWPHAPNSMALIKAPLTTLAARAPRESNAWMSTSRWPVSAWGGWRRLGRAIDPRVER